MYYIIKFSLKLKWLVRTLITKISLKLYNIKREAIYVNIGHKQLNHNFL